MSVLYKDGNGRISAVAGTLAPQAIDEIKQYIDDRTTLDYSKTQSLGAAPVYPGYSTWNITVPFRGQAALRYGNAQGRVSVKVNNTILLLHDTANTSVGFLTIDVEKDDIITLAGTVLAAMITPYRA